MLMTTLRDISIEKWHSVKAYARETLQASESAANLAAVLQRASSPENAASHALSEANALTASLTDHFRNNFNPSLRRLVYAGLLLCKYQLHAEYFNLVVELLAEVFRECDKLLGLPAPDTTVPEGWINRGTVGLELLLSARVLATYAVRTGHYEYLEPLLKQNVPPMAASNPAEQKPFLLWPLRLNVPGHDRIAYAWEHVARPYWLDFFGSEESYLGAACQLELVLHMNSYLATEIPEVANWLNLYRPHINFAYWYGSDLWRYSLNLIVPLAEKLYEALGQGPDAPFLLNFSMEQTIFQKAFRPSPQVITGEERPRFVNYLKALAGWQSQAALSSNRFPHQTYWGPVLEPLLRSKK